MATGFIVRRGGGGSRKVIEGLVAAIGVQYYAGWTCTCTKDSTTLTAKNTSGLVVFSLPEAGTWTVTATPGSGNSAQPKTTNVTIAENEVKRVNLRTLEILTPANGLAAGYSPTGGLSRSGKKLVAEGVNVGGGYITPKIDLTSYSTLTIKGSTTWQSSPYLFASVGIQSRSTPSYDGSAFIEIVSLPTTAKTFRIDVTSLTGEHWLVVKANQDTSVNNQGAWCEITEIILE